MTIPVDEIDAIFAEWDRADSPGCALSVIHEGEVVYASGYGMSNLEHGIPITPSSIFHIASISKQFTDMCIALLAAEGKLSLDDDIRTHVPEVSAYGETITIRHLIHHTSGLRDMWDLLRLAGWRDDDLITEADMLWVVSRQQALNFRPGDEYLYSNTGYALLALIVHRVSGRTLREFADERIFAPLGMTRTHVHDDHTEIVVGRTQAYEPTKGGGLRVSIPVFDVAGTTSLFTTVEDIAKWDDNFHDGRVGGDTVIRQMLTPGSLNGNRPMTYAFGNNIHRYRGLPIVEHSGADAGYRSHFLRFPDERLAVACFCNLSTMAPRALALSVADIVLAGRLTEPLDTVRPVTRAADDRLAGTYRNDLTGDLLHVSSDDDGLAIGYHDPLRLVPLDDGSYEVTGNRLTRIAFEQRDGATTLINGALYSPTPDPIFTRIIGLADQPRDVDGGEFYSPEVNATFELIADGATLRMRHYRLDERTLHHAYDDVFASDNLRVTLERDGKGRVCAFTASTFRVRGVRFVRN